ncbi:MAG TPA: GNAT family N-acetyltransferase [Kofleriaceae bacterium]|nr:GNAT family N-acetyltransferase [Kofleriaceae bacterium]
MNPIALSASVRRATPNDAAALAELVNRAYAIEAFFVDGDRTSAVELVGMMETGTFVVLEQVGSLAAAVYVESRGYFGMLAVRPELQGAGLGRRLVGIAEGLCDAAGAREMRLRIINLREELGRWYRSLGYREIGMSPYEHRATKRPCHFVEMAKPLRSVAAAA